MVENTDIELAANDFITDGDDPLFADAKEHVHEPLRHAKQ